MFQGYSAGYGLSQRDRDPLAQKLAAFRRAVPAAGEVQRGISAGYVPTPGRFGALEQPVVSTLQGMMDPRGSPQAYAAGRERITKGYGAQTGRLAGAGARRGYVSKSDIRAGAGGAPSAALAGGLGQYEVDWEKEMARQREAGVAGAQGFRQDIGREGQGYGAFVGEFAGRGYAPSRYRSQGMAQFPGYRPPGQGVQNYRGRGW